MAVDRVLANLDLNLLVTLDALLRERNVTRTAERLGVSQPAVSGALGRLRRHFGDQLLVRVGNRYDLTPLAARVAALTGPALAGVRRVFDSTAEFDPSGLDREFTIVSSDYAATILGPLIARRFAAQAPGARLRLQQTTPYAVDHAADTLRSADGLIIPHGFVTGLPYLDLYTDRWVCVVSTDHPDVGDALSLELLAALPWVVIFDRPTAFAPPARQLRMLGIEARVGSSSTDSRRCRSWSPAPAGSRCCRSAWPDWSPRSPGSACWTARSRWCRWPRRSGGTRCTATTRPTCGCAMCSWRRRPNCAHQPD
jgi:DNA-binding transcriptional LysR family regulator